MSEAPHSGPASRWQRLTAHVPPGQVLRFLAVGLWNTGFGYGSFALLTHLLTARYPRFGYMGAAALSSVLNISIAFLGYKWFVFKTRGNYVWEWLRCVAVYGSSIVIGLLILPVVVFLLRWLWGLNAAAPYLAGALLACFNAAYNFFGNKAFTFKSLGASSPGA